MVGEGRLASRIPAGLTTAQGRKFGLTVGGAFLVITAIFWWRHRETAMLVAGSLGTLFVLGGLLVPRQLGPVERAWMGLAHALNKVTSPVFLGVVFFGVFSPIGWIMRKAGKDPIRAPAKGQTAWATREAGSRQSALDHQF